MALDGVAGRRPPLKILPDKRKNFTFSQFECETYNFTWLTKYFKSSYWEINFLMFLISNQNISKNWHWIQKWNLKLHYIILKLRRDGLGIVFIPVLWNCKNLKFSPLSGKILGGLLTSALTPNNIANMYRKISAVIMALEGWQGGDYHPKILPDKKENFWFLQFLKTA